MFQASDLEGFAQSLVRTLSRSNPLDDLLLSVCSERDIKFTFRFLNLASKMDTDFDLEKITYGMFQSYISLLQSLGDT